MATVNRGWRNQLSDPVDILSYTSAQELATRISHRNAGLQADDPVAREVMARVSAD
ncbi:MAG TPA: acyl-ACP desaturase, partial [Acidimicrobiaceae bacterium]|nr:acyl-ACP desaturase [Acidimicrobiaceae bacterium]